MEQNHQVQLIFTLEEPHLEPRALEGLWKQVGQEHEKAIPISSSVVPTPRSPSVAKEDKSDSMLKTLRLLLLLLFSYNHAEWLASRISPSLTVKESAFAQLKERDNLTPPTP